MRVKKIPSFDFSRCVSCSICVQICPFSCIELKESGGGKDTNLYPVLSGECSGCGSCQRSCPMSAIAMEERADAN